MATSSLFKVRKHSYDRLMPWLVYNPEGGIVWRSGSWTLAVAVAHRFANRRLLHRLSQPRD